MTEDAALLSCCGLRKTYGKDAGLVRAVDGVDLDVAAGETVAIMGPSGCGKSTLLHLLGGLDRPSDGEVRLAGSRVDQMSERALARLRQDAVGFVFQAFHLMDELTAVENVELPALLAGRPARAARRRATELMERVGLADRARFLPAALSPAGPEKPWPSSVTSREVSPARSVSRIRQCRAPECLITLVTASRRHQASTASASGSNMPDRIVSPESSSRLMPAASRALRAVMTSIASVGRR